MTLWVSDLASVHLDGLAAIAWSAGGNDRSQIASPVSLPVDPVGWPAPNFTGKFILAFLRVAEVRGGRSKS